MSQEIKPHHLNERGQLTKAALRQGLAQRRDNVTLTQVAEGFYDVIAYGLTNKLQFWETYDNLSHAREAFAEQVRQNQ